VLLTTSVVAPVRRLSGDQLALATTALATGLSTEEIADPGCVPQPLMSGACAVDAERIAPRARRHLGRERGSAAAA
jgi:hypothetical protein